MEQKFWYDHDKRVYTIVEVTDKETSARHGQDEYGFKISCIKSRIISDSSVLKTAKGERAAKLLGSAQVFKLNKATKATLRKYYTSKQCIQEQDNDLRGYVAGPWHHGPSLWDQDTYAIIP